MRKDWSIREKRRTFNCTRRWGRLEDRKLSTNPHCLDAQPSGDQVRALGSPSGKDSTSGSWSAEQYFITQNRTAPVG